MRFLYRLTLVILLCSCLAAQAAEKIDDPVETVLSEIYQAWNDHNSEALFKHYGKDFVTGDGIEKEEYITLTKSLWEAYPDIKIENQRRTIRTQDQYATISGIDFFYGTSSEKNKELEEIGHLNAISQGQLFLQRVGKDWKVVSDKIQFELVTVYYGNAKKYLDEHQIYFSSPEQIRADEQYSGTLYFILPENIQATATINQELIQKPTGFVGDESFQVIKEHKLERLFKANSTNHNELISATIILSEGIIEPKLDGILYISKRVNVLPNIKPAEATTIINQSFADIKKEKTKSDATK